MAADVMARLALEIGANTKDFNRKLSGMQKSIGGFSKFAKVAGGAIAGLFAVGAIKNFVQESVRLADVQLKAEAQLKNALKGNIAAYDQLVKVAQDRQKVTLYGDEETIRAQSLISALVKEADQVAKITPLVQDLAAAKGMDLASAADLVAKTLGSSTNAMSRYGIQVTGAVGSTERLETLTKSLDKAFGGTAETMAKAGLGPVQQMQNAWGDMREELGKLFLPVLAKVARAIADILPAISSSFGKAKGFFIDIANFFIDLYNESMLFRAAVQAIGLVFKNAWTVIKTFFTHLWESFKLSGRLMKAVFTLQFDEIPGIIKEGFKTIAGNFADGATEVADNYKTAFQNTFTPREKIALITPSEEDKAMINETFQATGQQAGAAFAQGFASAAPPIASRGFSAPGAPPSGAPGTEAPEFTGKLRDVKNETGEISNAAGGIGSAFTDAFNQAAGAAGSFSDKVKDIIKGTIKGYIAEGIAGAVKNALAFLPFPANIIGAGIAGAGAAALFNKLIPSFDKGTSYVPRDMMAMIHKGEKITPAYQNRGGGGIIAQFTLTDHQLMIMVRNAERRQTNLN